MTQRPRGAVTVSPRMQKGVRDAGIMTFTSLTIGALGLIPHVLIAFYFGLGRLTDAYFMALSLYLMFCKLFELGPLAKLYVSILGRQGEDKAAVGRIMSVLLAANVVMFGGIGVVLAWAMPWIVRLTAPGFSPEVQAQTVGMSRVLMPLLLYNALGALATAALQTFGKFSVPAVLRLIPSLVMLGFFLATVKVYGIYGLIWGNLAGSLLHVILLGTAMRRLGIPLEWRLDLRAPELKQFVKLITPFYASNVATEGGRWFRNLLSSFLPVGGVSALMVAMRLRVYMLDYLLDTLPTLLYPGMVRRVSSNDPNTVIPYLREGLRVSNFIVIPFLVIIACLAGPLIRLVFQHGAFSQESSRQVSLCLSIMAIGLIPGAASVLVSRLLFAMQKTAFINVAKWVNQTVVIVVSAIGFHVWGLAGLALGTACPTTVQIIQHLIYLRKYYSLRPILTDRTLWKILFLNAALAVILLTVVGMMQPWLIHASKWQLALALAGLSISAGAVYLAGAAGWRIREFSMIQTVIGHLSPLRRAIRVHA